MVCGHIMRPINSKGAVGISAHGAFLFAHRGRMRQVNTVTELFGSLVFNERVMKERLPAETYAALKRTIEQGRAWTAASPTWWRAP